MQSYIPVPVPGRALASRRRSSSSSSLPQNPTPLSPLTVDPAYSNIITESPQSTSTSHVYPPLAIPPSSYPSPYPPRTPTYGRQITFAPEDSLSQVDESGTERDFPTISQSSRAPLLIVKERDYALDDENEDSSQRLVESGGRDMTALSTSPSRGQSASSPAGPSRLKPYTSSLSPVQIPPVKNKTVDPTYRPRPGPADAYISQFLLPIPGSAITQPPSPEPIPNTFPQTSLLRPGPPLRAASAPGVPLSPSALPPSHMAGVPIDAVTEKTADTNPLFRIFSAQLDVSAEEMVKRLKGHLGEVLKVQEEVGNMHLRLEELGTSVSLGGNKNPDTDVGKGAEKQKSETEGGVKEAGVREMVDKREQGVEEIMERLGKMSDTLRQYHQLGTPKLSFPPSSKPSSAYPRSSAPSPSTPGSIPRIGETSMATPTISSTPRSPSKRLQSPPQIHPGHSKSANLNRTTEGQVLQSYVMPTSPKTQGKHVPKVPSNLDQVTTADEAEDDDNDEGNDHRRIGKGAVVGGARRVLSPHKSPLGRSSGQLEESSQIGSDEKRRAHTWLDQTHDSSQGMLSSPMEMADRSRPW